MPGASEEASSTPHRSNRETSQHQSNRDQSLITKGKTLKGAGTKLGTINECLAFSPYLINISWPARFCLGKIKKYNRSTNPIEFLQIYTMTIEAFGGDEKVIANYLPTTLEGATKTWLTNLSSGTIYL